METRSMKHTDVNAREGLKLCRLRGVVQYFLLGSVAGIGFYPSSINFASCDLHEVSNVTI